METRKNGVAAAEKDGVIPRRSVPCWRTTLRARSDKSTREHAGSKSRVRRCSRRAFDCRIDGHEFGQLWRGEEKGGERKRFANDGEKAGRREKR